MSGETITAAKAPATTKESATKESPTRGSQTKGSLSTARKRVPAAQLPTAANAAQVGSANDAVTYAAIPRLPSGQFVHEDCYAIKSSLNNEGEMKPSARDVLGELTREKPERYKHLSEAKLEPKPAVTVDGKRAEDLIDWYETVLVPAAGELKESYVRKDGMLVERGQRNTTTILGCTVAGMNEAPNPSSPRQQNFEKRLKQWAKRKYGKNLVGIYRHDDEPLVHYHIVFADAGKQIKHAMSGHGAAEFALKHQGADRKGAKEALDKANAALQDEFQEQVAGYVGLARKGATPEKGRKSRLRWKMDKMQEEHAGAMSQMRAAWIAAVDAKNAADKARAEADEKAAANKKRAEGAEAEAQAEFIARIQLEAGMHRERRERELIEGAVQAWIDGQRAGGYLSVAAQSLQHALAQARSTGKPPARPVRASIPTVPRKRLVRFVPTRQASAGPEFD